MRRFDLEDSPAASRRRFLGAVALSALLPGDVAALRRARAPLAGAKTTRTTGSIAAGSNRLMIASAAGFAVGDSIIVEIGGEANGGMPGAPGVGGVWPALSYSNAGAMNADRSQPRDTYGYCADTGLVYQWNATGVGARWFNDPNEFYWRRAVPLALVAKIVGLSGSSLTLDASAAVTAEKSNVYFDNAPVFNAAARSAANDSMLIWPSGTFACGAVLEVAKHPGMTITGVSERETILFSPKGVISVGIAINTSPGTEVCHLTLAGNAYLNSGWGLDFRYTNQTTRPQWNYALDITTSDHSAAHDLTITYPWMAAGAHYCNDCTFTRVYVSTDGLQCYVSWMINWVNSTNCWSYDCEIESTYTTKAFECFASNHCGHIRPRTTNGVFALNSTGHCVLDSPVALFTANSVLSQLSIPFPGTPIVDVSTNIPQNSGQSGNAILNMNFIQKDYVNAKKDVMTGVSVNGKSSDTLISGGSYSAPPWVSTSIQYGAQAVNSEPQVMNTVVRNLKVVGLARDQGFGQYANIYVAHGSVTNCSAESIGCDGPGCMARGNRLRHSSG